MAEECPLVGPADRIGGGLRDPGDRLLVDLVFLGRPGQPEVLEDIQAGGQGPGVGDAVGRVDIPVMVQVPLQRVVAPDEQGILFQGDGQIRRSLHHQNGAAVGGLLGLIIVLGAAQGDIKGPVHLPGAGVLALGVPLQPAGVELVLGIGGRDDKGPSAVQGIDRPAAGVGMLRPGRSVEDSVPGLGERLRFLLEHAGGVGVIPGRAGFPGVLGVPIIVPVERSHHRLIFRLVEQTQPNPAGARIDQPGLKRAAHHIVGGLAELIRGLGAVGKETAALALARGLGPLQLKPLVEGLGNFRPGRAPDDQVSGLGPAPCPVAGGLQGQGPASLARLQPAGAPIPVEDPDQGIAGEILRRIDRSLGHRHEQSHPGAVLAVVVKIPVGRPDHRQILVFVLPLLAAVGVLIGQPGDLPARGAVDRDAAGPPLDLGREVPVDHQGVIGFDVGDRHLVHDADGDLGGPRGQRTGLVQIPQQSASQRGEGVGADVQRGKLRGGQGLVRRFGDHHGVRGIFKFEADLPGRTAEVAGQIQGTAVVEALFDPRHHPADHLQRAGLDVGRQVVEGTGGNSDGAVPLGSPASPVLRAQNLQHRGVGQVVESGHRGQLLGSQPRFPRGGHPGRKRIVEAVDLPARRQGEVPERIAGGVVAQRFRRTGLVAGDRLQEGRLEENPFGLHPVPGHSESPFFGRGRSRPQDGTQHPAHQGAGDVVAGGCKRSDLGGGEFGLGGGGDLGLISRIEAPVHPAGRHRNQAGKVVASGIAQAGGSPDLIARHHLPRAHFEESASSAEDLPRHPERSFPGRGVGSGRPEVGAQEPMEGRVAQVIAGGDQRSDFVGGQQRLPGGGHHGRKIGAEAVLHLLDEEAQGGGQILAAVVAQAGGHPGGEPADHLDMSGLNEAALASQRILQGPEGAGDRGGPAGPEIGPQNPAHRGIRDVVAGGRQRGNLSGGQFLFDGKG